MMAKTKASSHTGNTVLFLYPNPNSRREPSGLYKNPGLNA